MLGFILMLLLQSELFNDNFELGNIHRWLKDFDNCRATGYQIGCEKKSTYSPFFFEYTTTNCVFKLVNGVQVCIPKPFLESLQNNGGGFFLSLKVSNNYGVSKTSCLFICDRETNPMCIYNRIPLQCVDKATIIFLDNLESGDTSKWKNTVP